MRLTSQIRCLVGKAVDRGVKISLVAKVVGITRRTAYKWIRRRKHTKDRKREAKKEKITLEVELMILALRNTFDWGTARIQQGLYSLPPFMIEKLKEFRVRVVQNTILSRTSINKILKKHEINGYEKKYKKWKFFRAKRPNELFQLDIKGPFKVEGIKYYFVICIDDYSRYLLLAEQLDHSPSVEEICKLLEPLIKKHKPMKILTDNNPFREEWNEWCKYNKIEALHAHPYYPQDKGKVERTIRNVAEEFVYLLKKFPGWLDGKIKHYQRWYNEKRFHRGVNAYPYELYT